MPRADGELAFDADWNSRACLAVVYELPRGIVLAAAVLALRLRSIAAQEVPRTCRELSASDPRRLPRRMQPSGIC